jgi:two-component system cell cycle sensor histidine kinase/response regulator CckA
MTENQEVVCACSTGGSIEPPDFRSIFYAIPGACIVLRPNDPVYTVVAANRDYAEWKSLSEAEIAGRSFFDVCNAVPAVHELLRASLRKTLATKARHSLAARDSYGKATNTPVFGSDGEVRFIVHWVEEPQSGSEAGYKDAGYKAEARYQAAFEQAPIGMVLLNPLGELEESNQAYLDMVGYEVEELFTRDSSGITHPEDRALTREFFASLRRGPHRTGSIEKRYIRKDGEILWACMSGTMQRDRQGKPAGVVAIVEDITARKRAESRYRFLAESIPQMVWTATPDGRIDYVNVLGTAYFGVPQEALLGAGWLEWVHPDERDQTGEIWKRSLETGTPYETAFRLRRSDGTWRWHLVRAKPFTGENGSIAQWFGTCTDIEDERQADANLQRQWRTFDTALSHTPDFAYIYDLDGRFTYANRALLELWRISLKEGVGKTFFDLGYPPELAARLQDQIQRVIETKQVLRDQTPFAGPAGVTRYYDYIFTPVLDGAGEVTAVAGSTRDITEQKLAAERIEEDRRRWRELLLQTPAAIALMRGTEHRFEWVNNEYCQHVGWPAEALVGKTVVEALPEVADQVYLELLNNVYRTGEPFVGHESPVHLVRSGGKSRDYYVNFVYSPTRDVAGEIDGIFAHVIDVTDLVSARKSVEASEERFRLAFQAVEGIVYDWDPRTGSVQRSGSLEKLLGVSESEAEPTARWWQERVHPEDLAKSSLSTMPSLDPERNHFETEFRVRHADGHWVYACDRGYIIRDQNGAVVRVVGSTHDVTEERNLLNALRQSEARFRQAIDSMPQIVWSALPDGAPDLYNRRWFEYTGLSSANTEGDQWTPVHPDEEPRVRERWREALATGEPFDIEFRCRRFDGQYRWFLSRAAAIRDEQGNIVRWFGTSTDIEDRRKAELAVLTKQKLESLGLLAGGIAHDFNNLLVGILGGASFAVDSLGEEDPLQAILGVIVTAAERAAHLTRQMLAYAGKGRFLIESIDLAELVRSTCSLIRGSIPKHVQIRLETSHSEPTIEADSGQMQQIVMNLILNAAEAIDDTRAGEVVVRTRAVDLDAAAIERTEILSGSLTPRPYLVLEVQDNGSGMDHDTRTKIFDPFFTTKFTGRGLGLSAVQGILRTHNGALELDSRLGEGSTFRVFLPASGKAAFHLPLPVERAKGGAGTVLVVDDEEIVRQTTKASLERAGFQVVLAESGETAIRILLDKEIPPVHLIVLDMSMPNMNGKDAMERIRQLGIAVPVLICSGYSESEVCPEFAGLDVAGFIQKPFTARELTARVRCALPGAAVCEAVN